MAPKKLSPVYEPWAPADYEMADLDAVRAVWAGQAMAHQQRRAIEYLMRVAGAVDEMSFSPVDARRTDFMEGRRFVGRTIRKFVEMPGDLVAKMRAEENAKNPKRPTEQGS